MIPEMMLVNIKEPRRIFKIKDDNRQKSKKSLKMSACLFQMFSKEPPIT